MRSAIVAILSVLLVACGKDAKEAAKSAVPAKAAAKLTPDGIVEIPADSPKLQQIVIGSITQAEMPFDEFIAPGKIELNPNRVSKVLLPVAGRVTEVFVKFGDSVKKDDPLVTLESPEADAAASNFLQSEAAVTQAKANLSKAQADYDRATELFKSDAIAKKEVLNADNLLSQAKTALEQARAGREQGLSRLELLGLKPGNFRQRITVRAPLAGKITEIDVVAGEIHNDLSDPLMTIADLSNVWVSSDVPESSIRNVKVNERFDVSLAAYPGETFHSRVARVSDKVDPASRTVEVWAELANPGGKFKPEMFGQIRHVEGLQKFPVSPFSAIVQMEGRTVVFKEIAKGRYQLTDVVLGIRAGDKVAIRKGLSPGDRVVVDGAMLLRGM